MRFLYFLAFLSLFGLHTYAQSLTIGSVPTTCLGSETLIDFSSTATFASDNVFTVDVRGYYSDSYLKSFPATLRDGKLVILIKDLNFPDYVMQNGLQARLKSTKPSLQSDWSTTFYQNQRATVTLSGLSTKIINPYEPTPLQFTISGTSPINVVLSDSSRFSLSGNYYSTPYYTTTQNVTPQATTTYSLVRVSNVCGLGSGSGSTTLQVNPIAVRTTAVSTPKVCIGSELRVRYTAAGGNFSPTNQFKIRLTAFNQNTSQEDPSLTYDLDAVLENGVLKTTIPATIPTQTGYTSFFYSVRVVSTAPAVLGDYAGYTVEVRPTPSAIFTTGSRLINIGQSIDIGMKFQGLAPFSALLSDGTVIQADSYNDYGVARSVSPIQSTTYTIKSLQTGCGSIPSNTASSVEITVNPGMAVDSVSSSTICEGQTLRIKVSSNVSFGGGNQFWVRIRHNSGFVSDPIPAQQQGNYLIITVPAFTLMESATSRYQAFSFQISSTQPATTSDWQGSFNILGHPTMQWSTSNTYTIDKPQQQVGWYWIGAGGGPYQLEMSTGATAQTTIWDNGGYIYVPGFSSQTFQVKSIKNACFTTNNPAQASLTVKNSASRFIYVNPPRNPVCQGDSLEITFQTIGDFESTNQFQVQARGGSSCCEYPSTWGVTSNKGSIKLKLPMEFGWYSTGGTEVAFRIASTNPVVFSEDIYLSIHRPVYNTSISGLNNNGALLIQPGTQTSTINYLGGTPITINYAINNTNYSQTSTSWYSTDISYPVSSTTTFTLKSLANACGEVPINKTITYQLVQYLLQTAFQSYSYDPVNLCAGSTFTIPYVMVGQPDPNISLSVQYRDAQATEFKTLQSNLKSNPVSVTLPDSLPAGDYTLRLVSNLNIVSATQTVRVHRKATAELTASSGGSVMEIYPNNYASLKVNLTGSPNWTVFSSDGQKQTFGNNPGTLSILTKSKTTYSLRSVYNFCGYGTTSGEVAVSVKPLLSLSTNNSTFCANTKLSVNYSALGDFAPSNQLKIGLYNAGTGALIRWLDSTSTTQGTFQLALPSSLTPGPYLLKLTSTNPVQEASTAFQLTTTPNVSIGGNTIINPQQSALIRLSSNLSSNDYTITKYTLSTGETGEVYLGNSAYTITVRPTQTTTYTLKSVSNSCGNGQVAGSATVTVNPVSDRQINTQEVVGSAILCSNDTVRVPFDTKGTFSASNQFSVQLSDSLGNQFTTLPTFGTTSPLKALVPANLPRGSFYHVRVIASDASVSSSANPTPLLARYSATASFESAQVGFEPGKSTKVKINLTGDSPWFLRIGNEFNPIANFNIYTSPYTLELAPTAASTTYKLYQVSNICGIGKLVTPSVVQITALTATDPLLMQRFLVYPNPTTGFLQIRQEASREIYTLRLVDSQGRIRLQTSSNKEINDEDLSALPNGAYLLQLDTGKSSATFRILKQ